MRAKGGLSLVPGFWLFRASAFPCKGGISLFRGKGEQKVEGDRAKERQVKIGRKYGEFMEITEGLREEETVVTVGQNNLMEGVLVNVAR
jgi:multidrug efflux pump subunit AcrA (membrane-fusion protein)